MKGHPRIVLKSVQMSFLTDTSLAELFEISTEALSLTIMLFSSFSLLIGLHIMIPVHTFLAFSMKSSVTFWEKNKLGVWHPFQEDANRGDSL